MHSEVGRAAMGGNPQLPAFHTYQSRRDEFLMQTHQIWMCLAGREKEMLEMQNEP